MFAPDLTGKAVQILPSTASKGVVVFFVLAGCPNAQAYVPEMNRIANLYGPKGWKFYLAYADTFFNRHDLAKSAKQYGYTFPVVLGHGKLVARAQATKSPEAAVFSPSGNLLYHGRIDDRFYALGKYRLEAKTHDLRNTLVAIEAGKPAPHASTEVVGCFLPHD